MVDVVEQTFYVELQNPVIFPAPLTRGSNRVQGRFPRSVAVGVWQEYGIQIRLYKLFDHHLRDTIASSVSSTLTHPSAASRRDAPPAPSACASRTELRAHRDRVPHFI